MGVDVPSSASRAVISSDAGLLDDTLDDAPDALDVLDALDVEVVNAAALESANVVNGVRTTSTSKADAERLIAKTRDTAADASIACPTREGIDGVFDAERERAATRDAVCESLDFFSLSLRKPSNPSNAMQCSAMQ